jgi:hypothetical protein
MQRIIIFDGDSPSDVAERFCAEHSKYIITLLISYRFGYEEKREIDRSHIELVEDYIAKD